MRKIFFSGLIFALCLAVPLTEAFTDTSHSDNESAIDYLYDEGVIEGYSDGTYKPDNSINRAEFVKILMESKYPNESTGSNCFSDVSSAWYAPYVCYAQTLNIVDGYSDSSFKPDNNINGAEALKVVLETYQIDVCESCYSVWYEPYYNEANSLGLLDNMSIHLSSEMTRGEMAQLVYNVILYLQGELDPDPTPVPFDENDYTIYETTNEEEGIGYFDSYNDEENYKIMAVEKGHVKVLVPEGYEQLAMAQVEDLTTCEPLLSEFFGIPFPEEEILMKIYIPTDGKSKSSSLAGVIYYAELQSTIDANLEDVLNDNPEGFLYESSASYCANTHELTHAFFSDDPLPSWGDEGMAEYSQSVNQGDSKSYISCRSTGYYSGDTWVDFTDLADGDFGGSTDYHTAMCLMNMLVEEYGADGFQSIAEGLNEYHTGEATWTKSSDYHFVNDILIPRLGTSVTTILDTFGIEPADYAL